ncbi:alpha/beta hydrolase [Vandammella animalimorsus]|uniref:Alpha/beta hydrolase n=1 Tax=Vandammella animalimorsus TaxID=2029117 RepID=A0A2A2APK6_9BURK|nr:alpha/beta hydrolase [Vandammella animalimorsus]PAT40500.1 alpha/beta hydrolase [Vandammella animalimorsus]
MQISLNGQPLYAYTGGTAHKPGQPWLILIHGVLNDHSVWALQSRWFAHHGWNVLAIDLPGHGRSAASEAPATVQQAADTIAALVQTLDDAPLALAGHSFGSLIALQAAAQLGARVHKLLLLGTAAPMRVSPALLELSQNAPEKAMHLVNVFSRSTLAPPPSALGPGTWPYGMGMALGRRVLRSNPRENIFHKGFVACDSYEGGPEAMAQVKAQVLILSGSQDQMTPARAAKPLVQAAQQAGVALQTASIDVGHNLMTEAPEATLQAMRSFLQAP